MDLVKNMGAAILLLLSFMSNAAVIKYDEAISGDLSLNDFVFDTVGKQTFKGNALASMTSGAFSQDGDLFDFSILSGLEVSNVLFTATLESSSNVSNAAARIGIRKNGEQLFQDTLDILGTMIGGLADIDKLPLGNASSLYRTGAGGLDIELIDALSDYSISFDWALTFDVQKESAYNAVPEPATFALFGIGMIGLGVSRRKKA
jgi:hypothetical protein